MPTYRLRKSGAVYTVKNRHNRQPHYGKKESAKLAARLEPVVEEVACRGCGEYGEPNYADGQRYCGSSQGCCP